jgi:drug/metabolite transporter superfamily protein YnfA
MSRQACQAAPDPLQGHMRTLVLFIATALAEIVGCYLPYLWLKQSRSAWLLVPAALSLALFAWLLTFHETAAGRLHHLDRYWRLGGDQP